LNGEKKLLGELGRGDPRSSQYGHKSKNSDVRKERIEEDPCRKVELPAKKRKKKKLACKKYEEREAGEVDLRTRASIVWEVDSRKSEVATEERRKGR